MVSDIAFPYSSSSDDTAHRLFPKACSHMFLIIPTTYGNQNTSHTLSHSSPTDITSISYLYFSFIDFLSFLLLSFLLYVLKCTYDKSTHPLLCLLLLMLMSPSMRY